MIILLVVVAVLVVGAALAWAVSRTDLPGVPDPVRTESAHPLPSGPLEAAAVHGLRFDVVVRGYRMEQVDAALDQLAGELAERDAEIERLRGGMDPDGGSGDTGCARTRTGRNAR